MAQSSPYGQQLPDGVPVSVLVVDNPAGASPQSATFQIPANGVFLVTWEVNVENSNSKAVLFDLIRRYNGSTYLASRTNLAATTFSQSSPHGVSGLSVGSLASNGQITLTVTWTDATSQATKFTATIRKVAALS